MSYHKATESSWIRRRYPGSPISLVPFAKGEEILTSETSGIERCDTRTPKKLLLGDERVILHDTA